MPAWIYPLTTFFLLAPAVLIPAAFVVILTVGMRSARIPDPAERQRFARKAMIPFAAVFLFVVIAAGISRQLLDHSRRSQFYALALQPPAALTLERDGKAIRITDADAIRSLIREIQDAPGVGAHHSHPVAVVRLRFEGVAETYSLAPDSAVPDEYWFTLESGQDLHFGERGGHLRQLRSARVTEWLRRQGFGR